MTTTIDRQDSNTNNTTSTSTSPNVTVQCSLLPLRNWRSRLWTSASAVIDKCDYYNCAQYSWLYYFDSSIWLIYRKLCQSRTCLWVQWRMPQNCTPSKHTHCSGASAGACSLKAVKEESALPQKPNAVWMPTKWEVFVSRLDKTFRRQ